MQNSVKYVQNKHMASEGCSCDDQEKELLSSSQGWCQVSAEACRGLIYAGLEHRQPNAPDGEMHTVVTILTQEEEKNVTLS